MADSEFALPALVPLTPVECRSGGGAIHGMMPYLADLSLYRCEACGREVTDAQVLHLMRAGSNIKVIQAW
jgi:hypothetical protein